MTPRPGPRPAGGRYHAELPQLGGDHDRKKRSNAFDECVILPNRHRPKSGKKRGKSTRRSTTGMSSPPLVVRSYAQAAVRLPRTLTPAPGPDPAPASGPPTGLVCANWSSCRGQHRGVQQASRRWPSHDDSSSPTARHWPTTGEDQSRHIPAPFVYSTQKSCALSPLAFAPAHGDRATGLAFATEIGLHSKIGPSA